MKYKRITNGLIHINKYYNFMQNIKIIITIFTFIFISLQVEANDIQVSSFYQLMNSYPGSGDTIEILNDLDSSSTIGYNFYGIDISFQGQQHSIDGNNIYGGFVLNQNGLINQLDILNCKGQEYNRSNFAGALYNSGGIIDVTNSNFRGNFADSGNINFAFGGAIYNLNGGIINLSNTLFTNNYAKGASTYGGAIANGYLSGPVANMTISDSRFISNYINASVLPRGGAIYNNGNLSITTTTFANNSAQGETGNFVSGGAIYNEGSTTIADSELMNNDAECSDYSSVTGGGIYNSKDLSVTNTKIIGNSGTVNNDSIVVGGGIYNTGTTKIEGSEISSNIIKGNNTTTVLAGALYNSSEMNISNSYVNSNQAIAGENSDVAGGAIYNIGTEVITNSVISDNIAQGTSGTDIKGGAIYNNSKLQILSTSLTGNSVDTSATGEGGAIYNDTNGNIELNESTVSNNKISIANQSGNGGAIYNTGTGVITNSVISDNIAQSTSGANIKGGAIYNNSNLQILSTSLTGNSIDTSATGEGGAIYNDTNGTIVLKDATVSDNKISETAQTGEGGAIYNAGIITIEDSTFQNNLASTGKGNDIYNANGTVNIEGSGTTNILSGISGDGTVTKNGTGILNLGGVNENYTGNFSFDHGTINLLANSSYFNAQNTSLGNDVNFNMQNNQINNINWGNLTLNGTTNLFVDANLIQKNMDTISADSLSGAGTLFVRNINLEGAPEAQDIILPFANNVLKDYVKYNPTKINTPIYEYNVVYDSLSGDFNFTRGVVNPAILTSEVTSQLGGYLVQLETYKNIFANYDMTMISPSNLQKSFSLQNKTADSSNQFAFSPLLIPEQRNGIWVKPYTTFENVPLKNGPDVSNVIYGTIIGGDSKIRKLKRDWYNISGAYVAYNGSHQAYMGNSIYNNGGLLGVNSAFYKGKLFTVWTANVGANASEAHTQFGKDNFSMLTAGIAQKTGYNFELLERKLIIQPSVITSYSFINTFDYTTASNVSINTEPLHALHVEPGIKFIGNFKNYCQPYLSVSFAWNLIDHASFRANDATLSDLSVKPYVQYGVGVQKRWGERFTGFIEGMIRNGGRNGIGLLFGFRISL